MWIDISHPIETRTLLHPGDPRPQFSRYSDIEHGADYNLTQASLSLHTGTHFDAPLHFVRDGASIDQLPLATFITTAHVIETGGADCIKLEHFEGHSIERGEALLFKTANAALPQDRLAERWVYITQEVAQWCVDNGISIVGIDYIEVENPERSGNVYPVHQTLLPNGVLLLENLDLSQASAGRYRLICPPIKITGVEGAPCRALLGPL